VQFESKSEVEAQGGNSGVGDIKRKDEDAGSKIKGMYVWYAEMPITTFPLHDWCTMKVSANADS